MTCKEILDRCIHHVDELHDYISKTAPDGFDYSERLAEEGDKICREVRDFLKVLKNNKDL
jgi:hypothetical protein